MQADGTQPLLRLEADEYTDGKLDWHTFTLNAAQAQAAPNAQLIEVEPKRPPIGRKVASEDAAQDKDAGAAT